MTDSYNFQITDAKREAVPPLIALWGMSGSGKTLSALYLARGIVGPQGCIAVLDTENGRAKFYAEEVGGWKHVDMQPPFAPEKYSAGFKFCEDQGADIIIVDSASHVWEGEGGVVDMADSGTNRNNRPLRGLSKWNAPKMAHKRMMNNLMRSPLPVIFCVRAKEKMAQTGSGSDMEIVSKGFTPIAEKNFIYEMTLALRMTENGRYDLTEGDASQCSKIHKDIKTVFPAGAQITSEMGEKLAAWLAGGEAIDPESIKLRRDGKDYAMQGMDAYKPWFEGLTKEQKKKIAKYHDEWKRDAIDTDAGSVPDAEPDNDALDFSQDDALEN